MAASTRAAAEAEQPQPTGARALPAQVVRVGMGQMLVRSAAPAENLARAAAWVERAARERCEVVVLPECLDLGWTCVDAPRLAQPVPGPSSAVLAEAARRHRMWVVAGLTERAGECVYNSSVLLDAEGELRLKHRKINELEIAWHLYARGTRLEAADTPFGRVGIPICADNSPDATDLALALGRMGTRLVLSPCAWAVPVDYDNVREPYGRDIWDKGYGILADRRQMATIGVSGVGLVESGPWQGRHCIGSSLAMGFDGRVLARLPFGVTAEEFRAVEVPLAV